MNVHRIRCRRTVAIGAPLAVALGTTLGLLFPTEAVGQIVKSPPPEGAETHTAVIGDRYANGGFSRFFFSWPR